MPSADHRNARWRTPGRGAPRARRAGIIAGAAAAVLALGGCAAGAGAQAGSQAEQVSVQVAADAFEAAIATGSAQLDGTVTTNAGGQEATFAFSGPQSFDPAAMDISVESDAFGGGALRQVLVDGVLYLQVPELGSSWVKLPVDDFAASANPYLAPQDSLEDLVDLRRTGTGTVAGAEVTFYEAGVDLGSALAALSLPDQVLQGLEGKLADEPGRTNVRLAVDGEGRLVQWTSDTAVQLADGSAVTAKADLKWTDFGRAVDVAAPAPGDVLDLGSLGGLVPGLAPQG